MNSVQNIQARLGGKFAGMRNIVAHSYGTVDPEITWEILTEDIPKLKAYCCRIINAKCDEL